MTELMCRACGLCRVCSDPRPDHNCPYPIECAPYHKCPKVLLTEQKKRVRKSAVELEAEVSENDMLTDTEKEALSKQKALQPESPQPEPEPKVSKSHKQRRSKHVKKERAPSNRVYPKCEKCGHLMNFHKDGQCRMSRLKTGPCQCPNVPTSSNTPAVPSSVTGGIE